MARLPLEQQAFMAFPGRKIGMGRASGWRPGGWAGRERFPAGFRVGGRERICRPKGVARGRDSGFDRTLGWRDDGRKWPVVTARVMACADGPRPEERI